MADDEARARAILADMQTRLARGPAEALGVDPGASQDQLRSVFLGLTKTFHPARFGRLSPEIQKLSNDVFIALKGAYEALANPANTNASGALPPQAGQAIPQPITPVHTQKLQPPPPASPAKLARAQTPAQGVAVPQRHVETPTQRISVVPPPAPPPPVPHPNPTLSADERKDLAAAAERLAVKDWAGAFATLSQLRARQPQSNHLRALLCYARARIAQAAGKGGEAAADFQRALQFDPDLADAKSALGELMQRG